MKRAVIALVLALAALGLLVSLVLESRSLPVDTHVHRVALRLGLIAPRTDVSRAHDLLEAALRPDEMYPFHVELIRHGRDTCRAPRPICGLCPLTDVCPYFALASRGRAPMASVPRARPGDAEGEPRFHDQLIHGWAPPERRAEATNR